MNSRLPHFRASRAPVTCGFYRRCIMNEMRLVPASLLCLMASLVFADPSLRERLASEDPTLRRAAAEDLTKHWEDLPAETLEELMRLSNDEDAEVAAAARVIHATVLGRRRFGPWLAQKASGLREDASLGDDVLQDRLSWAAGEWREGRASDVELGAFLSEAWEAAGRCPLLEESLIGPLSDVRPYARLFAGMLHLPDLPADQRAGLLQALISAGDDRYADELLPYLDSRDRDLLNLALDGLARLHAQKHFDRIKAFLASGDPGTQWSAISALSRLDSAACAPLSRPFIGSPDEYLARRAISIAVDTEDRDALPALVKRLDDKELREEAACAIGALGGRLPEEKREAVFWGSARCDTEMERAVFGEKLSPADRDWLLREVGSGQAERRERAAIVLADMLAKEDLPRLRPVFDDSPARVRRRMMGAFGQLPAGERILFLRELLTDDSAEIRAEAARWLTNEGDRASAGAIAKLLNSTNDHTAARAAWDLLDLGAIDRADLLVRQLSREGMAGEWAAEALVQLDARDRAPALREFADRHADKSFGKTLLNTWCGSEDEERLVALLDDPDSLVRTSAFLALIRLGCLVRFSDGIRACQGPAGELPDDLLIPLFESEHPDALRILLEQPVIAGPREAVEPRFPWLRLMAGISPAGFRKLPADVQRDARRRLRNLSERAWTPVRMLARTALARHGFSSDAELLELARAARAKPQASERFICYPFLYIGGVVEAIAWAKEPKACERMFGPITPSSQIVTEQDLDALLRTLGLELGPGTLHLQQRSAPGIQTTVAAILRRQVPDGGTWVIDGRAVRVMSLWEAADFWREKLGK